MFNPTPAWLYSTAVQMLRSFALIGLHVMPAIRAL
jgi:hypothetical protein